MKHAPFRSMCFPDQIFKISAKYNKYNVTSLRNNEVGVYFPANNEVTFGICLLVKEKMSFFLGTDQ